MSELDVVEILNEWIAYYEGKYFSDDAAEMKRARDEILALREQLDAEIASNKEQVMKARAYALEEAAQAIAKLDATKTATDLSHRATYEIALTDAVLAIRLLKDKRDE